MRECLVSSSDLPVVRSCHEEDTDTHSQKEIMPSDVPEQPK